MEPEIVIKNDYDGYFEGLVRSMVKEKVASGKPFNHTKIVVTAGPWRQSALSYASDEETKTITLDWYAALRRGFGEFSDQDRKETIELL